MGKVPLEESTPSSLLFLVDGLPSENGQPNLSLCVFARWVSPSLTPSKVESIMFESLVWVRDSRPHRMNPRKDPTCLFCQGNRVLRHGFESPVLAFFPWLGCTVAFVPGSCCMFGCVPVAWLLTPSLPQFSSSSFAWLPAIRFFSL